VKKTEVDPSICRALDNRYPYWYLFLRKLDPMKKKYDGIKWRWIYPHWFRAQRASQMGEEFGMRLDEIGNWGSRSQPNAIDASSTP
jgi:hypothetical protein